LTLWIMSCCPPSEVPGQIFETETHSSQSIFPPPPTLTAVLASQEPLEGGLHGSLPFRAPLSFDSRKALHPDSTYPTATPHRPSPPTRPCLFPEPKHAQISLRGGLLPSTIWSPYDCVRFLLETRVDVARRSASFCRSTRSLFPLLIGSVKIICLSGRAPPPQLPRPSSRPRPDRIRRAVTFHFVLVACRKAAAGLVCIEDGRESPDCSFPFF